MIVYNLTSPIIITLPYGNYVIDDNNGNYLYQGRLDKLPLSVGNTIDFDIAPIIRQLIRPFDYSNTFVKTTYSFVDRTNEIIRKFAIEDANGILHYIDVVWDYSMTVYDNEPINECVNYGIQNYIYDNQLFPFNYLTDWEPIEYLYLKAKQGNNYIGLSMFYPRSVMESIFATTRVSKAVYSYLEDGDELAYWSSDYGIDTQKSSSYIYKECVPTHTFTMYFVNKRGGLSWCHFDGKNIVETNVTRNQITHQNPYTWTTKFGIDNYSISEYKTYTLNTDYLNDVQSEQVQELVTSPFVWLQDYDNNRIFSVVITDTTHTIKNKKNDKLFNYTIKCKESNQQNIYA